MHHYVDARPDRKERGAFFTPATLADFISSWAVRVTFFLSLHVFFRFFVVETAWFFNRSRLPHMQ